MQKQGRSQVEQAQLRERWQTQLMHELQEQHQQQMAGVPQEYENCWCFLNTAQEETSKSLEGNVYQTWNQWCRASLVKLKLGLGSCSHSRRCWLVNRTIEFQTDIGDELLRIKSNLSISLRGSALTVLTNLPEEQRRDYILLCRTAYLWSRVQPSTTMGSTKRREKTLPELAEDEERQQIGLSWSSWADGIVFAKDQFVDALPVENTWLIIRQSRPTSLSQALETAMELESNFESFKGVTIIYYDILR